MAETVTMPKLGFDMAEGTLVRWVIAEGQQVAKGAVLAEIETDKATVEVESTYEGTLRKQLVSEGAVVPVGTPIAIIGSADEKLEEPSKEGIVQASQDVPPGAFTPKEVAEGSEGGTKPSAGVGDISPKPEAEAERAPTKDGDGRHPAQAQEEVELPGGLRASPLARRMAEEKGLDLKAIQGSGPQGRIVKSDVEAYLEHAPAPTVPSPTAAPAAPTPGAAPTKAAAPAQKAVPMPAFSPVGPPPPDEEVPLSRLRAAIGRRMVEVKQRVPHFYVTHEYNMEAVMALRKQINEMLGGEEKLSVNDFIVKAVALNLRQFPNLNASLAGDKVIRRGQVNVGVAVAVEGGLLTVVNRDTDRKPLRQIAAELRTLVARAREGKVRPDDIEGSTFSISNLGMYDVESFIAIINPPEAAILAVGSAREVPVVENGEIKPGMRMKATISIDHRVSDGAEGARFMQALAQYLEEPMRLLL